MSTRTAQDPEADRGIPYGNVTDGFVSDLAGIIDHAFQPICDINTGAVYGYEALLRGFEDLGIASIDTVFDRAHEAGSLTELELLLRRRAVEKFSRLPDAANKKLFLNIDGRLFDDPGYQPRWTSDILKRTSMPESILAMELSERFDNAAKQRLTEVVDSYRHSGYNLAIDDFGRGFSELKVLYDYEPDFIKIDRFFITDIGKSGRKRLFVSTIVNLAHVLGIRVVAEGVETVEEFAACRQIGCDLVQGYFVQRPFTDLANARNVYETVRIASVQERHRDHQPGQISGADVLVIPTVSKNADIAEVIGMFGQHNETNLFPVVDDNLEPCGIIRERDLKELIYNPHGHALLANKNLLGGLRRYIRRCPVADINCDADAMLAVFANGQNEDGVILTDRMKYAGFVTAQSLLRFINEQRLAMAEDQNPLTRLPGNRSIDNHIAKIAGQSGNTRTLCYFDFDNFKPFNDMYGFHRGDQAISAFGNYLSRKFNDPDHFVGHIGGDDFFVALSRCDPDRALERLMKVANDFRTNAEKFYSAIHRRNGGFIAADRNGEKQYFPLMRVSIAALVIAEGVNVDDIQELKTGISELKKHAKADKRGVFMASLQESRVPGIGAKQ
jgi:diguanylate cyclase (GGDEF)-like protein